MNATWLVSAAVSLALAAPAVAQQREAPPAPGRPRDFRVPSGRSFELPNGLRVTMVPYGTVPKASIRVVVRTGNLNEGPTETWLADLTGDLMREGTARRNVDELNAAVAGMGGDIFIGTGMDQTTIGGDVLSEFVPDFVRLAAEVVRQPRFPESELARLKQNRVRAITVSLRQPGVITQNRFREAMYPDHPYGRLYPTPEQVNGYTMEQIRAYHAANFGALRTDVFVVGRFDQAATERAIREAFGDWARGAEPVVNVPVPQARRDLLVVDRPGAPQSTINVGLPVPNPSSADWIPMQVTNALLGGFFSSRITFNIRETRGYTYSPFSTLSSRYRDAYWAEIADVTTNVTGPSLHEIFGEIDRLRGEAPGREELEGVQNYMAGTFVLQNSSRGGIAGLLGFLRLHGLDQSYLGEYVQRVYGVAPDDVRRMAQQYLDPARMLIVVTGDRRVIDEQLAPYRSAVP